MANIRVKICGLRDKANLDAAVDAGAAYVGFVFFEKSPRYVTPSQAAELAAMVPVGVAKVGLFVNPNPDFLQELLENVPLDILQLHGKESPQEVEAIKARTGLPVMKAVGIAEAADLAAIDDYARVADMILVDTKAPKDAELPGGNGVAFNWGLLQGRRWSVPWMLAGGLNAETVGQAVAITGARQVDLSSAVETSPGQKDPGLIRQFIEAADKIS